MQKAASWIMAAFVLLLSLSPIIRLKPLKKLSKRLVC